MKVQNIITLLSQVEKEFAVDQWVIDDIHVWPIIRLDLMMSLSFNESPKQQIKINFLFKLLQAFGMIGGYCKYVIRSFLDRQNNAFPHSVDAVFFGDGISRILLEKKWLDRFCDPLIQTLEHEKKISFMMEPLHHYIIPRHSPSLFIQPHLDFVLTKNMIFKGRHFKTIQLINFGQFIDFLKSQNLNIPLPDEERVKTILLVVKSYAVYYKKILQKTRPSLGFVVCYYGPRGLAFNLACRQLGITSVDIQHGVAGEANPAYGQWSKVPHHGYELLPSIFWCWTSEDAHAIERWNSDVKSWHKPVVGGHPFVHFWKQRSATQKIFETDPEKGQKNLLVTLSYIEYHNEALLSRVIKVAKQSNTQWKWWIRLHPCLTKEKRQEVKTMFKNNNIDNVEIDRATDLPLYSLLNETDVHVTYVSATVVEARLFGVPSVVTGEDAIQYFSNEISTGWALYADTPERILNGINAQLSRARGSNPPEGNGFKITDLLNALLETGGRSKDHV